MRSSWQVTRSVWHAMFMREALARITAGRFAWFWMFVEPIAFVVIMVAVREMMGRIRLTTGAEFIPWLITGLLAFSLFRDAVLRSIGAVDANQGLFAYRQVSPVDPVLVRIAIEGLLQSAVFAILIVGVSLLGHDMVPSDPLGAIFVWASIWLLGLGGGLVASVAADLIPELGRAIRMMMLPMFMLSGAIIPLNMLPHHVQQYLMLNPALHGVEALRLAFFPYYKAMPGVDLLYLWSWALAMIVLGLALHVRFAMRMKAK
jgi:capsular polysaccharide transport system permease protein